MWWKAPDTRRESSLPATAARCAQIASYSLQKAADRLARAKRKRASPDEDEVTEAKDQEELVKRVRLAVALSTDGTCSPPACDYAGSCHCLRDLHLVSGLCKSANYNVCNPRRGLNHTLS